MPSFQVSGAVEGDVDEAVLRRLLDDVGVSLARTFGKRGKAFLHQRINAFNQAAVHSPWIVLVDLDREALCPPPLLDRWLPEMAPKMCFRIATRAVEAWLLADRRRVAEFLGVNESLITRDPEAVNDPKQELVKLARRSRSREVREGLVPRDGSGRKTGPAYASYLIEFVASVWSPSAAATRSESLNRTLVRVGHFAETGRWR